MNAKVATQAAEEREYRIVIANMDKKTYETVKKLAEKEERKIGKMAELLLRAHIKQNKL